MGTRRQFFRLSIVALIATVAERVLPRVPLTPVSHASVTSTPSIPIASEPTATLAPFVPVPTSPPSPTPTATLTPTATEVPPTPAPDWSNNYLAMVQHEVPVVPTPTPTPPISGDDMPIMGPATGSIEQAITWFDKKIAHDNGYTRYDITTIVQNYQYLGDMVGLDWFLALAQMGHETGHLSSWWSARPRRNPAGIGVTGTTRSGTPDAPPGRGWNWDDRNGGMWREGWAFPTWDGHSIPAHLGRLLAYTMRDEQANATQLALINYALGYRPLPASLRGIAPTITGLNGRWAVPGTTYGQSIVNLVRRMRGE